MEYTESPVFIEWTPGLITGAFEPDYVNPAHAILKIYPNPVKDFATIEFQNKPDRYTIDIYNSLGQLSWSMNNINSRKIRIEKGDLSTGFYYIILINNTQIIGIDKLIIE